MKENSVVSTTLGLFLVSTTLEMFILFFGCYINCGSMSIYLMRINHFLVFLPAPV